MDEHLKQRLVGAAVLIALAVIFLPSLFYKEERVVVATTTQIPPPLIVEPVVVPQPQKPETAKVPPVDKLFQPEVVKEGTSPALKANQNAGIKPAAPRLTQQGVPVGWVIQVASLKSEQSANTLVDKLVNSDFKAYQQPVETTKGQFFRVFVGPFIDQQTANQNKKRIDKTYQVQSRVLRFNPVSGN